MQAIRTWWGQLFIAALEEFTDENRLARGRSYSSNKRIKSWKLKDGVMSAQIRGNVNPYFGVYEEPTYKTSISLQTISADDWELLISHIGNRASLVSRLLLNEMPDTIEKPFELLDLHLLPHSAKDFKTRCSCPDDENPCKHVAGLCYFLSSLLDQDPFLLFELRGLSQNKLLKKLKQTPLGKALAQAREEKEAVFVAEDCYFTRPLPLSLSKTRDPKAYWECPKRLPEEIIHAAAGHNAVPALLVKKGGDFPAFWKQTQSFPAAMEVVYGAIRKNMKQW